MMGWTPQQRPLLTPQIIPPVSTQQFGMIFPANNTNNSSIQIRFTGGNMVSRSTHTAIWWVNHGQQLGYYATVWHTQIIFDTFPATVFEYGCHPFPSAAGARDGTGQCTDGTGGSGAVHYYEIAGLGASDFISSPGGSPLILTTGVWVLQARTCEVVSGTTLRHTFYPDLTNNASFSIVQDNLVANLPSSPTSPCFQWSCSPWRNDHPAAGQNDETINGTLRGLALFSARLTLSDIQTEGNSNSNSPQTSAGAASVWYINKNPTPTDISDKSSGGHNPAFVGANRPTLYSNP